MSADQRPAVDPSRHRRRERLELDLRTIRLRAVELAPADAQLMAAIERRHARGEAAWAVLPNIASAMMHVPSPSTCSTATYESLDSSPLNE